MERTYDAQDITLLMSGTLIIFITSLFMNGGAGADIVDIEKRSPNNIVMNTVIAGSTSGLTMMLMN